MMIHPASAPPLFRHATGLAILATALLLASPGTAQAQQGTSPLACFHLLQRGGMVEETTAIQLCQGARSTAPAQCFLRVQDEAGLSTPQALQLCQYATPEEDPADCFLQARDQTFLPEWEIIRLCKPALSELLRYCPAFP